MSDRSPEYKDLPTGMRKDRNGTWVLRYTVPAVHREAYSTQYIQKSLRTKVRQEALDAYPAALMRAKEEVEEVVARRQGPPRYTLPEPKN